MTLQEQVCTLEQAKRLRELGCKQKSGVAWFFSLGTMHPTPNDWYLTESATTVMNFGGISAYTVAELGEMLILQSVVIKEHIEFVFTADKYLVLFGTTIYGKKIYSYFPTEAQARAALLIHCLEQS
jgi:hypothetical protein